MEDLVNTTVDGRALQAPKGMLLWELCKANGIDIPIFCYHTKLGPVGACRTCLVEQEGVTKGPITACSTPVTDGMVIRTRSAVVEKAQRGIFEFLLANHPLDCPICDRAGECPLQDQTFAYGPGTSRYVEPKRHHVKPVVLGPTIALDRERCVLCWRCVRFCSDVAEDKSIVLLDRGDHTIVGTFQNEPYVSKFSGNVVELCPVGALTSRKQRFNFRPWELQNRPSICPHCPMGCNINISVRKNDEIIRFLSRDNPEVDDSWLCDRGRYNFEFINSPERIKSPLLRRGDSFVQVSWDEALSHIAERIQETVDEFGPESVAGIASPRLTNEDLFVFKRFLTDVVGSQAVDHYPRSQLLLTTSQRSAQTRLQQALTSISKLQSAGTILLLGADPSRREPVMELRIREAVNKHDARLIALQSETTGLSSKAHQSFDFASPEFAGMVSRLTSLCAAGNGLDADHEPDPLASISAYLTTGPVVIVYDDAFEGVADKGEALEATAGLVAALSANVEVGVLPLLDDCNSMGARDLGLFPGGADAPWGRSVLDALTAGDTPARIGFVLGSNPIGAGNADVAAALRRLDLLVVTELMMTETSLCADVVLPAASFAEKMGTFTSSEGRIQLLSPAVPTPGIARSDWEILVDLSQYFSEPLPYARSEEIWDDIRASTPAYGGLRYEDVGPRGVRPHALQLV